MKIERIEDKKFQVTISEEEALFLSDQTQIDFEHSKLLANHLGSKLLFYMIESSAMPDFKIPPKEIRL